MYIIQSECEQSVLRQGDIVEGVELLGAIKLSGINVSRNREDKITGWNMHNQLKYADAMVLSHSCEIDPSNNIKLTSIILAPIRGIDGATPSDQQDLLIESNYLREDVKASFIKYFYLYPNEKLAHSKGAIVDFSKCFRVKKDSYKDLVEKKIIQIDSEARAAMALKLAVFFHRAYQKQSA